MQNSQSNKGQRSNEFETRPRCSEFGWLYRDEDRLILEAMQQGDSLSLSEDALSSLSTNLAQRSKQEVIQLGICGTHHPGGWCHKTSAQLTAVIQNGAVCHINF